MALRLILILFTLSFANLIHYEQIPNGIYKDIEHLVNGTVRTDIKGYQRDEFRDFKGNATYYFLRDNRGTAVLDASKFEAFKDDEGVYIASNGKVSKLNVEPEFSWYWMLVETITSSAPKNSKNTRSLTNDPTTQRPRFLTYSEKLMMYKNGTAKVSEITPKILGSILKSNDELYEIYKKDDNKENRMDLYIRAYFSRDYSKLATLQDKDIASKKKSSEVQITMKNGMKYKGRITEENDNFYKVNVKGDIVTIYKSVVEKIEFK